MIQSLSQKLFANKFLLIAASTSIVILFIITIITSRSSAPTPSTENVSTANTNPFSDFANLTEERLKNASDYRSLIQDRLPIYLSDYTTTTNITTTISISIHPSEPSLTRLDITGLSYLNKDELDPTNNPNIVAFEESFKHALNLLREAGIDPKQLLFNYSEADYVRATATHWVDKLGLLR